MESKELLKGTLGDSGYWTFLDFSSVSLQANLDAISSKFNMFDSVSLVASTSTRINQNFQLNGQTADYIWSGDLSHLKGKLSDQSQSNPHTILKWKNSDKEKEAVSESKSHQYSGNKTSPSLKEKYTKKESYLKEKFKTKED